MRMHGVVIVVVSVGALSACGRTDIQLSGLDGDSSGSSDPSDRSFEGVAVRHIDWSNERSPVAPDDGVWLVFGAPEPNCVDPVVSGGGIGWHIATYIPPAELGDGVWDYADGGYLDPDAHQGWFFSWYGDRQQGEHLRGGSLALDELREQVIFGRVQGVVTGEDDDDLPDPERVDADVAFTWCP